MQLLSRSKVVDRSKIDNLGAFLPIFIIVLVSQVTIFKKFGIKFLSFGKIPKAFTKYEGPKKFPGAPFSVSFFTAGS